MLMAKHDISLQQSRLVDKSLSLMTSLLSLSDRVYPFAAIEIFQEVRVIDVHDDEIDVDTPCVIESLQNKVLSAQRLSPSIRALVGYAGESSCLDTGEPIDVIVLILYQAAGLQTTLVYPYEINSTAGGRDVTFSKPLLIDCS